MCCLDCYAVIGNICLQDGYFHPDLILFIISRHKWFLPSRYFRQVDHTIHVHFKESGNLKLVTGILADSYLLFLECSIGILCKLTCIDCL